MKKTIIAMLGLCTVLTSCFEDRDVNAQLLEQTAQKVQGKWLLQRTVAEVYEPIGSLSTSTEYTGKQEDSLVFQTSKSLYTYSPTLGNKVQPYEIVNPSQVFIDHDIWWFEKLTTTEMVLLRDRNDVVANKRYVNRMYLRK